MEVYNAPEQEYADAYLMQGSKLTAQYTPQNRDHLEVMYGGGAPEFVVDQGIYYPAATNYGYIYTGVEPPGDWDDRQMVFGLDGQEVCYPGAESENLPFVYYTPNFAYAQSPYNPYNPYIPGAVFGVDGSIMGQQQYYNVPSYETHSSSPMYFPMLVQSGSEINAHNTSHPFVDTTSSTANRADGPSLKQNFSTASRAFSATPWLPTSNQTISYTRASDGNNVAGDPSKQYLAKGRTTSSALPFHPASSPVIHGKSAQGVEQNSPLKSLSNRGQSKFGVSSGSGFSNFRPGIHVQNTVDKVPSKFPFVKVHDETKICAEKSREQNLPPTRPKSDISENKLTAKVFSSRAGDADKQGNIANHLDQYDKNDFLFDYPNAKFFVIKSYSEDDVHKSIKYKVWSSTPNGNKKLNSAYEDAQRISHVTSGSCPIFLFFSVNASGQFCGVAEMTGPVDFHKDMDFWQQDKWSGSFPVKWHIIKDVPNPSFRHILLENNENKPVTNSRDTQEIRYKKGMEMLKIYRDYLSRTSLLDDFLYYDNRQRILQEEKSKLLLKNYNNPSFMPVINPPRKITGVVDGGAKNAGPKVSTSSSTNSDTVTADATDIANSSTNTTQEVADVSKGEPDLEEALKIGSLNISSTQSGSAPTEAADGSSSDSASNDVLTVGSIPLKVNGSAASSGVLTFGTIPVNPKALQDFVDGSTKPGNQRG